MIKPLRKTGRRFRRNKAAKSIAQRNPSLQLEALEKRELLTADTVFISEFMASNDSTVTDRFGLHSDWVELFNPTADPVSLTGWHLTDNAEVKEKWTFPDVTLDSGQFLLVFASGRDLADPASELHTNFRLSAAGEYLGLVRPDGTVAQDFGETYPEQFADVSFGVGASSFPALADDTPLRYHVPTVADAGLAAGGDWAARDFDDATWTASDNVSLTGGLGYGIGDAAATFEGQMATNVEGPMFLANSSLWIRQPFEVADPGDVDGLLMDVQFDDAFVAYLNGEKVAEMFTPQGDLAWNSVSDVPRRQRRRDPLEPVQFDLGQHTNQIVQGTNILAINLLNVSAFDEDVFVRAKLKGFTLTTEVGPDSVGYVSEATPGSANRPLQGGSVVISVPSQVFTDPLTVELSSPFPGQTIRYTTDGTVPTADSPVYTEPIPITGTTTVRSTAFSADGTPGPVSFAKYIHLADDAATQQFSSNLPLVVLTSNISRVATSTVPDSSSNRPPVDSFISVIEPDATGRTKLSGETVLNTRAGINRRGSSTSGNPKLNLAVELWDDSGTDTAHPLVGMPADADWVFYAPYNFDRTHGIRNSFFYEIANEVGPWAPRTRFVEVFHNVDGDDLTADDYQGIYVIIDKIQRGENRVNIEKLSPEDIAEPEITGGWIWKVDRGDPGDSGFSAGGQSIKWVNPKEAEVEAVPEQVQWAKDYFNNMASVFRDSDSNWQQITDIIDVDSWIDHAIINTLTFNLDAYRLSGYFYKDRGGKLEMGPVWDCDRCMGSEDSRDNDPEVWHSRVSDYGTDFFGYPWWRDLYRNQPNFWQAWIDRWFELREEVLSDSNMDSIVDQFASQLRASQQRDTDKWRQGPTGSNNFAPPELRRTWEGEVLHLKGFNRVRAKWIDERFVTPVEMTPDGGKYVPGQQVTLSAPKGKIYYTTDGTDPRASGGAVAPGAIEYAGPITVDRSVTITARAFDDSEPVILNPNRTHDDPRSGSFWSAPTTARFTDEALANRSNLRITEINYNPPAATPLELQKLGVEAIDNNEFEFLELTNTSGQPINLGGVQMVRVKAFDQNQGVTFIFSDQMLDPGERIVVTENADAFRARFGDGVRIAAGNDGTQDGPQGQWGGNLSNGGEAIKLVDKFGQLILRLSYDDAGAWPERADGGGSSLELIDVSANASDPSNWRASTEFGGSPGATGAELAERIVVTEVLSNTDQPQGDKVELHNTTAAPLDITNWFLSDSEDDLLKFKISEPTVIPAGGYAVFTEQQMGFGFDGARGGQVFVLEADSTGKPLRFASSAMFGNSALNVSLGRWPDAHGEFFAMAQPTFGSDNSGVRPGDVIISEVHYSPMDPDGAGRQKPDEFEFVELFNQTASPIDLGGWRLTGDGVDREFADGTMIGAGESLVLVPFDPSSGTKATVFRFFFNAPASVALDGSFLAGRRDSLNDEGAHLLLERPGTPPADDPSFTPYIWVDELTYDDALPWPTDLMGNGNSLTRVSGQQPAFLPTNWVAKPASPGTVEFIVRPTGDANQDGVFDQQDITTVLQAGKYLADAPASFAEGDWNGDGVFNQLDIVVALQAGNYAAGQFAALKAGARPVASSGVADRVFARLDPVVNPVENPPLALLPVRPDSDPLLVKPTAADSDSPVDQVLAGGEPLDFWLV